MRARAKIIETKKRYEATISIEEIRKRFRIPEDALVAAVLDGDDELPLAERPNLNGLIVSYERVK